MFEEIHNCKKVLIQPSDPKKIGGKKAQGFIKTCFWMSVRMSRSGLCGGRS